MQVRMQIQREAISVNMRSINTLRDVTKYPYGTLSPEYVSRNLRLEQQAHLFLGIDKLGDSKLMTPVQILEKWFRIFFSDPINFFCCTTPSRPLFKLCDFLTRSPFFCLYVASITLGSIHMDHHHDAMMESGTRVPRVCSVAGFNKENDKGSGRVQSMIGICANPPKWIFHKNRRIISTFLQMVVDSQGEIRNKANGYTSRGAPPPRKYVHTKKRLRPTEEDEVDVDSNKRRRDGDEVPIDIVDGGSIDIPELADKVINPPTHDTDEYDSGGGTMVKKKKKSAWNLIAYLVLDCQNHSPHLIHTLIKETHHSKGINNRIHTLCSIGKRLEVPLWVSRQVMDDMQEHEKTAFVFS